MAYRMECFGKAVIAGDTCPEGAIYMPILHQAMALHSTLSISEPLHSYPTHSRLYIASFVF